MLMLFHLHFVQESGWRPAVCVRDSARSLSLLQSDFFREEPVFLSSLYYDSSPGFSLVSLSAPSPWSPTCQETVSCLQSPAGPSPVQHAPGPQALTHPLPSPRLFPLPGSLSPHFSTFCDKLHSLSLGESSLATSSHPRGHRGLPQAVSPQL